jgi:hypothetical protein
MMIEVLRAPSASHTMVRFLPDNPPTHGTVLHFVGVGVKVEGGVVLMVVLSSFHLHYWDGRGVDEEIVAGVCAGNVAVVVAHDDEC